MATCVAPGQDDRGGARCAGGDGGGRTEGAAASFTTFIAARARPACWSVAVSRDARGSAERNRTVTRWPAASVVAESVLENASATMVWRMTVVPYGLTTVSAAT